MANIIAQGANKKQGSKLVWAKEVKSDGTDLAVPDTFAQVGHLISGGIGGAAVANAGAENVADAEGTQHDVRQNPGGSSSTRETTLKIKSFRTGIKEAKTAYVTNASKYYQFVVEGSAVPINGKIEYVGVGIAQINANAAYNVEFASAELDLEYTMQDVPAALTIDLAAAGLTGARATLTGQTIVIPEGDTWDATQVTVA